MHRSEPWGCAGRTAGNIYVYEEVTTEHQQDIEPGVSDEIGEMLLVPRTVNS